MRGLTCLAEPRSRALHRVDPGGAFCSNAGSSKEGGSARIDPAAPGTSPEDDRGSHETHLSSIEGSPRPHAWISGAHEDTRRTCGDQRTPCQGAQAAVGLSAAQGRYGRIIKAAEFERVLAERARGRSAHFAVHHLPPAELSTSASYDVPTAVDEIARGERRLGLVVPKRHARRAVMRALVKRQMRRAMDRSCARIDAGLWVLRLAKPIEPERYRSAASAALKDALRAELDKLLTAMARKPR